MSEFTPMTNKEIRRRAWELCRENFGLILSATFLTSLISTLGMNLATSMDSSVFSLLIGIALSIVSAIMSIGMVRFILDIWHGETPALSVLFSQKHRFGTFICYNVLIGLICTGIFIAAFIPVTIVTGIIQTVAQIPQGFTQFALEIEVVVSIIIAFILLLWIVLRFEMAVTCMIICPSYRTTQCMRTAWRASKGNVWRLLCNAFILGLPLFVAQGLLTGYQTYLMMTGQTLNAIGSLLLDFGTVLISALLSGYIYLGTYPLHEQLLKNYLSTQPAGMWTELPASDEEYEETDEYEDIPEDEEENNSPEN